MNRWIPKDDKTLFISALLASVLLLVFIEFTYVFFDNGNMSKTLVFLNRLFSFLLIWYVLYFLLEKYSIYKVLGIIGLITVAEVAERQFHISENPITIPLTILFWLGVAYLILPQFFKKYWKGIVLIYGVVIAYYFFSFISATEYGGNDRAAFAKYMVLPIPVFGALWLYEQWRWVRILKADRTRAELALLKNQVNPHFFFNTLNNLYGLVVEKSSQAPDVVLQLSDMMRYTIDMGKEDEVNILDEINYLENYIALHKIRYRKSVDIQFDHQIKNDVQVAPLLFINLLENAFKHGVESLTENAYIHLSLKVEGNRLVFKIANNLDAKVETQKGGTGLDNLKKRLSHSYPNCHELVIDKTEDTYSVLLSLVVNSKNTK